MHAGFLHQCNFTILKISSNRVSNMGVDKSIHDTLLNCHWKIPRCNVKWWKEEENNSWKIEPHLWKTHTYPCGSMYVFAYLYFNFHSCALISVRKNMSLNLKIIITIKTKQEELQGLQNPGDFLNSSVNSSL